MQVIIEMHLQTAKKVNYLMAEVDVQYLYAFLGYIFADVHQSENLKINLR